MKRKGFTLVELLVVISIIALLMAVLMPALSKVRQMAQRTHCGSNLIGIGKTIEVYSSNHDEAFPVAGGRNAIWGTTGSIKIWNCIEAQRVSGLTLAQTAYGYVPGGATPTEVTITASLFLTIKYSGGVAKSFHCKGDKTASVFGDSSTLVDFNGDPLVDISKAWDFGTNPGSHVSYSYHQPYSGLLGSRGPFNVDSSSSPQSPLMADKNPYCDKKNYDSGSLANVDFPGWDPVNEIYIDEKGMQNSSTHQRTGQNVLYQDGHLEFEEQANVGIDNDNIWHCWTIDNSDGGGNQQEEQLKAQARETGADQSRSHYPAYTNDTTNGDPMAISWKEEDAFLVNELPNEM
ncbi:MAG: type II secretion system protein [Planctomycetota bacterium]|jgi:prepilin-type N-terminal cleavage/methylation domain-containing protein